MERRRPLSGVERHPQQRPDALDRGRRPRQRVPQSVRLQQRQHLRLRRTPALLRARQPARRPLRAERHGHGDRREVSGQASELAERHRRPSRRRHLVHRSDLRHPRNYEGFKGEQETKEAVYRVDPKSGQIDKVTDEMGEPNGLCFSPDYKKLYVADTGTAARHQGLRRGRQDGAQRQALRFSWIFREPARRRGRRDSLRRRRQHLGRRAAGRAGASRRPASASA